METNWDNLRYFNALARHGTLSEAARQLGVSHSTVQRRITAFENEINAQLFNHAASGYRLTAAGETLYLETASIQQTLRTLPGRISDAEEAMSGRLAITVSDTIGHFLLPNMIAQLQQKYPQLEISVTTVNQLSNMQELEADIAIRSSQLNSDDLIGRQVGTIQFAVCASEHFLNSRSLLPHNAIANANQLITLGKNSGSHYQNWQPMPLRDRSRIEVNGFLGACQMCRAGLGIALLPAYILDFNPTLVKLPCDNLPDANALWVLSHSDLRNSTVVKTVRQYLAEQLAGVFG